MRFTSFLAIYGLCALMCINSVEAWSLWGLAPAAQRTVSSSALRDTPAAHNAYSYSPYLPYYVAAASAFFI